MTLSADDFFKHVDTFFDYRQNIYEASSETLKSNRIDISLFESYIRSREAAAIDGPAVIDFQYHLKNDRGNCGASINRKIFTLRSYGNFLRLYDFQASEHLPFYDVLKIRQGYRSRPHALTAQQIGLLFGEFDGGNVLAIRDYAAYALMYQLGLRVGEVHALDLESLDFENCKITVIGKGRKVRILPLNQELIKILTDYLAVREQIFRSSVTSALFVSKKGNRLAIRTMEDNIKIVLVKTDIHVPFNVSCHSLRHSLASHLNDKEVDILVIQSILGHSSTRSTEPYIHPSEERIRQAFDRLPGVIYVKELISRGILNLTLQKPYKSNRK